MNYKLVLIGLSIVLLVITFGCIFNEPSQIKGKQLCESVGGVYHYTTDLSENDGFDTCSLMDGNKLILRDICYGLECSRANNKIDAQAYWKLKEGESEKQ